MYKSVCTLYTVSESAARRAFLGLRCGHAQREARLRELRFGGGYGEPPVGRAPRRRLLPSLAVRHRQPLPPLSPGQD